jgi:hypothetical protein
MTAGRRQELPLPPAPLLLRAGATEEAKCGTKEPRCGKGALGTVQAERTGLLPALPLCYFSELESAGGSPAKRKGQAQCGGMICGDNDQREMDRKNQRMSAQHPIFWFYGKMVKLSVSGKYREWEEERNHSDFFQDQKACFPQTKQSYIEKFLTVP